MVYTAPEQRKTSEWTYLQKKAFEFHEKFKNLQQVEDGFIAENTMLNIFGEKFYPIVPSYYRVNLKLWLKKDISHLNKFLTVTERASATVRFLK